MQLHKDRRVYEWFWQIGEWTDTLGGGEGDTASSYYTPSIKVKQSPHSSLNRHQLNPYWSGSVCRNAS